MSIESHLVSLRTYLEDIASTQRQILTELRRGNGGQAAPFVGTLETEPPPAFTIQATGNELLNDNIPPWPDYDDMTVAEVMAKAALVEAGERAYALAYERQNKNRKGVIDALENWSG